MRLYDVDQSQEPQLVDDTPVFDKSNAGGRISSEKFDGWKL